MFKIMFDTVFEITFKMKLRDGRIIEKDLVPYSHVILVSQSG